MRPVHLSFRRDRGFVLVMALLLMLFIGVIVISSAQKTGVETRTAQSEAPIATMQAAAEEGFYVLRKQVGKAVDEGVCTAIPADLEFSCECINDIDLSDLFEDTQHPRLYYSSAQSKSVYWWFDQEEDEDNFFVENTAVNPCKLKARVFVGYPGDKLGHFMSGEISILKGPPPKSPESPESPEDIDPDQFYDPDFPESLDEDLYTFAKLPNNSVLNPSTLSEEKLNIIVLEGAVNIDMSSDFSGKQMIIVSNTGDDFNFNAGSTGQGSGKAGGQGSGGGGIEGWIIAPDSTMQMGQGITHLDMDINVERCRSTSSGNTVDCFRSQGGSGFRGFDANKFKSPPPNILKDSEDSESVSEAITVQQVKMNFDY